VVLNGPLTPIQASLGTLSEMVSVKGVLTKSGYLRCVDIDRPCTETMNQKTVLVIAGYLKLLCVKRRCGVGLSYMEY
jgi:hypothetical protein